MSKKIGVTKKVRKNLALSLDRLRQANDRNKLFLDWAKDTSKNSLLMRCITSEGINELREYWTLGYDEGETMDLERQSDDESQSPEGGMMAIAMNAWFEWSENNDLRRAEVDLKKYELMRDAFIDGYLNGFIKRVTG